MKKVLFTNGDSWTFGSEIMAPEFCVAPGEKGYGMAGRYKKDFNDYMYYNDYYRIPRTWSSHLGKLLDIDNVVNLSRPARSNDTIYESTINWVLENYIIPGKDTKELLVVIGWSSPERKNIIISESGDETNSTSWLTLWPAMADTQFYQSQVIKDFFKFYVLHQWVEQEYLKRFVEQNYNLQNFFKIHNIDFYLFNSFYSSEGGPTVWKDLVIPTEINKWDNLSNGWWDDHYTWDLIKKSLLSQWSLVDDKSYINKDILNGSFRSYIFEHVSEEVRMNNWHPSPDSHEAWANFLSGYINEHSDMHKRATQGR